MYCTETLPLACGHKETLIPLGHRKGFCDHIMEFILVTVYSYTVEATLHSAKWCYSKNYQSQIKHLDECFIYNRQNDVM